MSDNIDYSELDRAVNEAMNARKAAKAQPQKAAEPVKPAAAPISEEPKKPAAKPVQRGIMMDFAPRSKSPATTKVAVSKPVAKATPVRPTVKTVEPIITKPAKRIARPVAKPAVKPVAKPAPKPVEKPAPAPEKPAPRPIPARPAHPAQANARPVLDKKPLSKKAEVPKETPAKKEEAPTPILKKREAPNANNYSLGGRSPFMANTKVEKRPLGHNIPDTSASALRSTRNVYSQKSPVRAIENAKKHIIAQDPKGKSGWLWTLIVLAVIAAGGGLGYLAYLLVFAH